VAACRRWLGILIVVLNDEETVMRSGEKRLHADAINGLFARRASLPPLLATAVDRLVDAESLLFVITVWQLAVKATLDC
jgi:hypothetical protein